VKPFQTPFGEELVEFLHGLHQLHLLHVTIVSESGWSWALGWVQLGVCTMECVGFTDSSLSYGWQLMDILGCQDFTFSFCKPHESSSIPQGASASQHLVCRHILPNPGGAFLDFLARVPPTTFLLCTLHKDTFHQVQRSFGGRYHWEAGTMASATWRTYLGPANSAE
jgi:hypothetical protein